MMEYPQFIGLNFVVYLISLCRTDVLTATILRESHSKTSARPRGREAWLLPYRSQPPVKGGY